MKKLLSKFIISVILIFYSTNLFAQTGDADGDGVLDSDDLCPTTFGTKSNKGCPDENQNQQKISSTKSFGFVYKTNEKDSVLVDFVFEKSPADFAGIEVGDLIQSINNINVLQKPKKEVFEIIKKLPNENVKIILSRNGLQKEFSIQKVEKSAFANICITGNCTNGKGSFQDSIGNKYDGEFKNGVRVGNGKMYYVNGNFYNGSWVNNKMDGKGKFTTKIGDVYIGEFKNNNYEGIGEYKWANGDIYNGSWINGKKSGYFKLILANGDSYKGDFLNDKMNGRGTYKFASGHIYTGEFKNSQYEGYGELKNADGTVQKGMWVANVFQDNSIANNDKNENKSSTSFSDQLNTYSKQLTPEAIKANEELKKNETKNTNDANRPSREQMNSDAKKYNSNTAKKIDDLKKNSEELKKTNSFEMSVEEFKAAQKQAKDDPEWRKALEESIADNKKVAEKVNKILKENPKVLNANTILGEEVEEDEVDKVINEEGINSPTKRRENRIVKISNYLDNKYFEQAIIYSSECIKVDPNYSDYYYYRSKIYIAVNKYLDALKDIEKAIQINANDNSYYEISGKLNYQLSNFQAAISDYTNLVRLNPRNSNNYYLRAVLNSKINEPQAVIADCDEAITKGITRKDVFMLRGISKYLLKANTACEDLLIAKQAQIKGAESAFTKCDCK